MKYKIYDACDKVVYFKLVDEDGEMTVQVSDNLGHTEDVCFIDDGGVLQLLYMVEPENFGFKVDERDSILVD